VLVKEGVNIEVVGTGLVIIIEGFEIEATNMDVFSEDRPITARNLKVHLLSAGDTYQIPQINHRISDFFIEHSIWSLLQSSALLQRAGLFCCSSLTAGRTGHGNTGEPGRTTLSQAQGDSA
jgi:hypothetical protein